MGPERTSLQDSSRGARPAKASRRKVRIFDDSELCLVFGRAVLIREGFDVRVNWRLAELDRILSSSHLETLAAGCGADVSRTGRFELLPVTVSSLCEEIPW
jgi:hypothetical protein